MDFSSHMFTAAVMTANVSVASEAEKITAIICCDLVSTRVSFGQLVDGIPPLHSIPLKNKIKLINLKNHNPFLFCSRCFSLSSPSPPLQLWSRQSFHQPGRPGQTHRRDGPGSAGHVCQRAQEGHSPSTSGLWKHRNRCRGAQQWRHFTGGIMWADLWHSDLYLCSGGIIPPDAVLVYDVLLLDIWNEKDKVEIRTLDKPASCRRTTAASDFVRYHYNGTLLSGELFDSRWEGKSFIRSWKASLCLFLWLSGTLNCQLFI